MTALSREIVSLAVESEVNEEKKCTSTGGNLLSLRYHFLFFWAVSFVIAMVAGSPPRFRRRAILR